MKPSITKFSFIRVLSVLGVISGLLLYPQFHGYRKGAYAQDNGPAATEAGLSSEELLTYEAENRVQALADPNDPAELLAYTASLQPSDELRPNAPPTLKVGAGCTYATIGAAIAAAIPDDVIEIEGGVTFPEHLSISIDLTLRGGYDGCNSGSTAKTTIDGTNNGRVIQIYEDINVTLENLNIINGNESWGGGIRIYQNSNLTGDNLSIYNNTATTYGGGLRLMGAEVTLTNSYIGDNLAPKGAGIYATMNGGYAPSIILQQEADIQDNQALTGDGLGGGVYLSEGSLGLTNGSDIYSNDAIDGGGVYLITSTLTVLGNTSSIRVNDASSDGGGIYAQGSTVNLDNQAALSSNDAGTGGLGYGGGAYLDDSSIFSDLALIIYNTAHNGGGGVFAANGSELDMDLGGYACSVPRCSQFSENEAMFQNGGGIYASYSTVDLVQTFVEDNLATHAGAIYAYHSTVVLDNTLLAGNQDYGGGDQGDGIVLFSSDLVGEHNTLAYNPSDGTGTAIFIDGTGSTITLDRSIIWGHATSISEVGHAVTCSDIQGAYTGTDNRNENPLFVDPSSANFHLQSSSPVIDRCTAGLSVDFENDSRPLTYIRAATPYDMGADEAGPRVGINNKGCAYGSIQDAVDAAISDDAIQVSAGTYNETVVINTKDLSISGDYASNCTSTGGGETSVDGIGLGGSVFEISASQVTMKDLTIENGAGSTYGGGMDLTAGAKVLLDSAIVRGNSASYGGGIYLEPGTVITATNGTMIEDNTATILGGGARVRGSFWGEVGTEFQNNQAPDGGGIAISAGSVTLDDTDIYLTGNAATAEDGKGGGIYVVNGGTLNLGTFPNFSYNTAANGGGIYAGNSAINIDTGIIIQNEASDSGGGIYLGDSSVLTGTFVRLGVDMAGVDGNQALLGGGIYADASTVDLKYSYFHGNFAETSGAGIYADNAIIQLEEVEIGGIEDYQPNQLGVDGQAGVGLYLTNGSDAVLNDTKIDANIFQTSLAALGAGVYMDGGSTLLMENNSRVGYHNASGDTDGHGAGIYATGGVTLTLDNSQVTHNTAGIQGGGIWLSGVSVLYLQNGAVLDYNLSVTGDAGGIYSSGNSEIYMQDAALEHNRAGRNGGGVYLLTGRLDAINSSFYYNQSVENGGGIAIENAIVDVDADFDTCSPGSDPCSQFSNNEADMGGSAGGDGGAIYIASGVLHLKHTILQNNTAEFGGAVYQLEDSASTTMENSLFYDNSTSSGSGAAVRVFDGNLTATHLTLANNTGAPAFSAAASSSVNMYNSIAWLNPGGGFDGTGFSDSSCNIDQSSNLGSALDPLFVDAGGDDYHLQPGSPAINACSTGLLLDLDGVGRPIGSLYDMGAFEYLNYIFLPLVLK